MRKNIPSAFTLVELIVVITILAILWTLWFLAFNGFSRDARNSTRISDMKTIQKSLDLYVTTNGTVPIPDESISISYSWGLAWRQWYFWEKARAKSKRISNVPIDNLFSTPYAYSTVSGGKYYQLASVIEWGSFFSQNLPGVAQSYALSNSEYSSYVLGNHINYDVVVKNGSDCYTITAPSIILSDIPSGWILENNTPYNYTYSQSNHIPHVYSWAISYSNTPNGFQNIEVLNWCNIDTFWELELYSARLSTAYQQFSNNKQYENLVYNSKSNDFMLLSAKSLKDRWITVNNNIIEELLDPTPLKTFTDTFTDSNSTLIVWEHIPDSWGLWFTLPGGDNNSYTVNWNTLVKTDNTLTKIYPRPNPEITSENYTVNFNVTNFSSGEISAYLKYLDPDNYYRLSLNSDWYTLYINQWGIETLVTSTSWEPITLGSEIIFTLDWDDLSFSIAWNPKWNFLLWWINGKWNPVIWLENNGSSIDNFSLNYK